MLGFKIGFGEIVTQRHFENIAARCGYFFLKVAAFEANQTIVESISLLVAYQMLRSFY